MTMTDTQLHEAIASEALTAALDRLAAAEQTARADVARVVAATDDLDRADSDPYARERAAQRLAAAHLLVKRSGAPKLDAEGLRVVRQALAAGQRYVTDRTEYGPPSDDPRDAPERLRPTSRPVIEGQGRLRHRLADLRVRVDAWHGDPSSLDHAGLDDLLVALSNACDAADALRSLVSVATN
jgi:hypothetical protein